MIGVSEKKRMNDIMKKFTTILIFSMTLLLIGCAFPKVHRIKILDGQGEPVQGQKIFVSNIGNYYDGQEAKVFITDLDGFAEIEIKRESDLLTLGDDGMGGVIYFDQVSKHPGTVVELYELKNKAKSGLGILLEQE